MTALLRDGAVIAPILLVAIPIMHMLIRSAKREVAKSNGSDVSHAVHTDFV